LAAVAFRVLGGQVAFSGGNSTAILLKLVNSDPEHPENLDEIGFYPEAWRRVFTQVLNKDVSQRHPTCRAFLQDLVTAVKNQDALSKAGVLQRIADDGRRPQAARGSAPAKSSAVEVNDGRREFDRRTKPRIKVEEDSGDSDAGHDIHSIETVAEHRVAGPAVREALGAVHQGEIDARSRKNTLIVWAGLAIACLLAFGIYFNMPVESKTGGVSGSQKTDKGAQWAALVPMRSPGDMY